MSVADDSGCRRWTIYAGMDSGGPDNVWWENLVKDGPDLAPGESVEVMPVEEHERKVAELRSGGSGEISVS